MDVDDAESGVEVECSRCKTSRVDLTAPSRDLIIHS
jgi:hypothetical protein